MTTPLLTVQNLNVTLNRATILSDISFEAPRGGIHAIIGPNGAGKTTLMRALLGAMPHRGTIRFNFLGNGRIGYVPQLLDFDRALAMTVADFMALTRSRRPLFLGTSRQLKLHIRHLLKQTGCDHLVGRTLGSLSGGELRRVLLAHALDPKPEVLLLDEPASNVDENGARQFEALLLRLCRDEDITVILIAHDLAMIHRSADTVTVINRTVIFDGTPAQLASVDSYRQLYGNTPSATMHFEPLKVQA